MADKTIQLHIYRGPDGEFDVPVVRGSDNDEQWQVWLTATQMSELFGVGVKTIYKHIKTVVAELEDPASVANFATVTKDGSTRQVDHYDMEVITAVGHRVRSPEATRFRKWAASVLNDYLTRGVAINEARLAADDEALKEASKGTIDALYKAYRLRGYDDAWIAKRITGMVDRKTFTAVLQEVVANIDSGDYAKITNKTYTGLFGRNAAQLRIQNGGVAPRDGMHRTALHFLGLAESTAAEKIRKLDYVPFFYAMAVIDKVCKMLKPAVDNVTQELKTDIATNTPLLSDGDGDPWQGKGSA